MQLEVCFTTKKLQKVCNSDKDLVRRHGPRRAKLIRECLDDLAAIDRLLDIKKIPHHRCHELAGNRKGDFSMDLDHPYRLIFRPSHDPIPEKEDGGIDWSRVSAIVVAGVENTHGK